MLNVLNPAVTFMLGYTLFFIYPILFVPFGDYFGLSLSVDVYKSVFLYALAFVVTNIYVSSMLQRKGMQPSSISYNLSAYNVTRLIYFFFIVGFITYILIFYRIGFIPIMHPNAEVVRVTAKQGMGYFYLLGAAFLYVSAAFSAAYFHKLSRLHNYIFICMSLLSFFLILGLGYRGPALMIILTYLYCVYVLNDNFIKKRVISIKLVLSCLLLFVILVVVGIYRHENQDFTGIMFRVYWILSVNLSNLNDIVNYFKYNEFRFFSTILNDFLVAVPGFNTQFFGNELKYLLRMNFKGEGVTVTAPGEGYANLGFVGVVIHASILGSLCAFFYRYLIYKGTIVSFLLLAFISLNVWRVAAGGIMPMVIFSLIPILLVFFIFVAIIKRGKI